MSDLSRLLIARGLRALADGCIGLLLPVYLIELGFGAFEVGAVATATLLGSGLSTLALGMLAHRYRRHTLFAGAANLCLVLVPFASSAAAALVLLVVRSALSQMDVPARRSYVMAPSWRRTSGQRRPA